MEKKVKLKKKLPEVEVKKPVKEEIQEANELAATQQIIVRKDLKYIYPKGCITPDARKSHRAKIRNAIRNMEAKIMKLHGKERVEAKKDYELYRKLNLVEG